MAAETPYQSYFDAASGPEKAMWAIAIAVNGLTAKLGTVDRSVVEQLNGNTPLLRPRLVPTP